MSGPDPAGPTAPDRRGRWLVLLGAIAIAAPRLLAATLSDPFFDERTVFDLGRLAFSPCVHVGAIPWDQPPLANLALYLLDPLARGLGLDPGRGLDLPLLVGRLVVVAGAVAGWLLLRRALQPGLPRAAFFVVSLLCVGSLELSSLAMNNGFVVLPMVVALACFGGLGPPGRRGLALGGVALALAVGVAWIAWPAATGLGVGLLWLLWRRRDPEGGLPWVEALLALGPAMVVGVGWLLFTAGHADYLDSKSGLYRPQGWLEPLAAVWGTQGWYLSGREMHWMPPFSAGAKAVAAAGSAGWLGLAAVGALAGARPGERWSGLRPLVLGLAVGTWLVVLALIPVLWLGKAKYFGLLLAPTALLACRGLGVAMTNERAALRAAGALAGVAVAVALVLGAARTPVRWDRDYQRSSFYYPLPGAWSCEQPWVPSLQRAQDSERTLLPPSGLIVCASGGPCVQDPPAASE